jgi:glycosyltransferase involved in cell wall biosynthesis
LGVSQQRIACLELVLDWPDDQRLSRSEARQALAQFQAPFEVGPDEPLVLGTGNWSNFQAGIDLLNAWRRVRRRFPRGRLWILGDLPPADRIRERIHRLELFPDVVIAGWFDNWNDVLCAADVVVQAEELPGPHLFTLAALRRGKPVIACAADPESATAWQAAGAAGCYSPGDSSSLADGLIDALSMREHWNPSLRSDSGYPWSAVDLDDAVAAFQLRSAHWHQQQENVQH